MNYAESLEKCSQAPVEWEKTAAKQGASQTTKVTTPTPKQNNMSPGSMSPGSVSSPTGRQTNAGQKSDAEVRKNTLVERNGSSGFITGRKVSSYSRTSY